MFKVMTWNVENLFKPGAQPGAQSQAIYHAKIQGLASTINDQAPDVLALQEIFQHSGHRSRIYAGESCTISGTSVESLRNYHARARDILLIHYSLSSPLLHEAFATSSRKALVYHKITPAHYLAGLDPALPEGSDAARADLAQL